MSGFVMFSLRAGTRLTSFTSGIPQTRRSTWTHHTFWKREDVTGITRWSRETNITASWWRCYFQLKVQSFLAATTTPIYGDLVGAGWYTDSYGQTTTMDIAESLRGGVKGRVEVVYRNARAADYAMKRPLFLADNARQNGAVVGGDGDALE